MHSFFKISLITIGTFTLLQYLTDLALQFASLSFGKTNAKVTLHLEKLLLLHDILH